MTGKAIREALEPCLTLAALQRAHVVRQDEWCPDQKPDLSFRGNEMAGEVGEARNVIKKLERERHGWRGSRATIDDLGDELADVVHTAILCAITAGIDDLEARVIAKFNATSEKNGLATRVYPVAVEEAGESLFLIRKRGAYYRPNEQGYTSSAAEAGRYSRADAERITHPNGTDGPRDGMDYVPAPPPRSPQIGNAGAGPVDEAVAWREFVLSRIKALGEGDQYGLKSFAIAELQSILDHVARPVVERDEAPQTDGGFLTKGERAAIDKLGEATALRRELAETQERLEKMRDAGFNHGYLMAVANIINLHRETVVATDVLLQIDLTIDDAESFELAEYDMEALNRLRAEPRAADFFKSQRRTGDAQEAGR